MRGSLAPRDLDLETTAKCCPSTNDTSISGITIRGNWMRAVMAWSLPTAARFCCHTTWGCITNSSSYPRRIFNMSELAILGGSPLRNRPFSVWPQYLPADAERLQQVLESRHWGGYPVPSRYCGEFAERFAKLHGAKYGLCLANGTIAIVAALQAAGIRFGDEVIVPAYTWDGTATAVLFAGGIPIFADVDPDTYCLDVASAARAITPRTRAVIPVHLAMRFTDMNALLTLAETHRLKI